MTEQQEHVKAFKTKVERFMYDVITSLDDTNALTDAQAEKLYYRHCEGVRDA